jgi:hypothetical protein
MSLRQTVLLVALLNLAYFGVEFGVALAIGSVSLFADSVDFLEDASINLLIAVGLGWSAANRARLGMVLAAVILVRWRRPYGRPGRNSLFRCRRSRCRSRSPAPAPFW